MELEDEVEMLVNKMSKDEAMQIIAKNYIIKKLEKECMDILNKYR